MNSWATLNEVYCKTPGWPWIVNLRMDLFEVSPDSALYVGNYNHPKQHKEE